MVVKIWKLGLTSYDTTFKIQQTIATRHFNAMKRGLDVNHDTLILVEHKPIYTVGIRDTTSDKEIDRLKSLGADFKKTNRGGLITFHGPGQLVAYPVINLKHFRTSVKWYVSSLEDTVIRLCSRLGVKAQRSEYTGVWVDDSKLASIGIHASRYVTNHGIAVNCDNDLSWFDHIDPCGFYDKGVTSLTLETGRDCTPEDMIPLFVKSFENVFECKTEELEPSIREEILTEIYAKDIKHKELKDVGVECV